MIISTVGKGNSGKSTIAATLAVYLHDCGRKVAVLDCDQQNTASEWIHSVEPDITLRVIPPNTASNTRIQRIERELAKLSKSHDVVIADGPGGIATEPLALILRSDLVLVPVLPRILDLRTTRKLVGLIVSARKRRRGKPTACLVVNQFDSRWRKKTDQAKGIIPKLGLPVAEPWLRYKEPYADAPQQDTTILRGPSRWRDAIHDFESLILDIHKRFAPDLLPTTRTRRKAA